MEILNWIIIGLLLLTILMGAYIYALKDVHTKEYIKLLDENDRNRDNYLYNKRQNKEHQVEIKELKKQIDILTKQD